MKIVIGIVLAWILWINSDVLGGNGDEWVYFDGFDSKGDCFNQLKATGLANEVEVICRPDGYDPNSVKVKTIR